MNEPHYDTYTVLITGASRGLGAALAHSMAARGWDLVLTARGAEDLEEVAASIRTRYGVRVDALPGDVADPDHRAALASVLEGRHLHALVNNASDLGPSPMPALIGFPEDALARLFAVNVLAPLALVTALDDVLVHHAHVVNVSSDAAAHAYAGWGGYGASKAALDHATRVLAIERPGWRVHAFDPGEMDTRMHADAFPGAPTDGLADPAERAPALVSLVVGYAPSGRYVHDDATLGGV